MPHVIDYVSKFSKAIDEKYAAESKTYALTRSNTGVSFQNAKTIKVPDISLTGFNNHARGNSFKSGSITLNYTQCTLSHDRDAEFIIDAMDVEECSLDDAIASLQSEFEAQHAIPEWDAYRISKTYQDWSDETEQEGDEVAANASDVLNWYDEASAKMDDASVPEEGRILYCTPNYARLLNKALTRSLTAKDKATEDVIERLGNTEIIKVPSARMYTDYSWSNGFTPEADARKIGMLLIHPSAVIARTKHAYMKLFTPGSDSRATDCYIYQIRQYGDLFVLKNKVEGIAFALSPASP